METCKPVSAYQSQMVCPYSLGKLIEWKPDYIKPSAIVFVYSPYSLGKLIEWKLDCIMSLRSINLCGVPTR